VAVEEPEHGEVHAFPGHVGRGEALVFALRLGLARYFLVIFLVESKNDETQRVPT
jgi:hypothetical protein